MTYAPVSTRGLHPPALRTPYQRGVGIAKLHEIGYLPMGAMRSTLKSCFSADFNRVFNLSLLTVRPLAYYGGVKK